jgi:hypothetical protein
LANFEENHLRFQNEVLTFVDRPVGSPRLQEIREWDAKIRGSGRIVRHSEVIQFDGLSANRRLRAGETP